MTWKVSISKQAEIDLSFFKKNEKTLYIKCFDIMRDIILDPYLGIGKPEKLKYIASNLYSRRINKEHRCVYEIDAEQNEILIIAFRYHYKK